MTSPKLPPIPSIPKGKPPTREADQSKDSSPSADAAPDGAPAPMKFELAMTRDEIYSDSFKIGKGSEPPPPAPAPAPVAAPVAELGVDAPPTPGGQSSVPGGQSSAPTPAGPPGLLLARRRQSASQRLMSHPIVWPAVGASLSLLVGFFAAFWISGTLLTSNVKPLVTERAILLKTPVEQRDTPRISGLEASIADARASVAWKCGGLWTLVFAAGLFTWTRVFRE